MMFRNFKCGRMEFQFLVYSIRSVFGSRHLTDPEAFHQKSQGVSIKFTPIDSSYNLESRTKMGVIALQVKRSSGGPVALGANVSFD